MGHRITYQPAQPAWSIDRIGLKAIEWKRSLASSGAVVPHDPLLAPARVSAEGRIIGSGWLPIQRLLPLEPVGAERPNAVRP